MHFSMHWGMPCVEKPMKRMRPFAFHSSATDMLPLPSSASSVHASCFSLETPWNEKRSMYPRRAQLRHESSSALRNSAFVLEGTTLVCTMMSSRFTSPFSMRVASASQYCISDVP